MAQACLSKVSRLLPVLTLALAALTCASCGSGTTRQKTYPVAGKVLWKSDKTPAINALVVFRPTGDAKPEAWPEGFPRGTVGADGSFKLTSYVAGDGAPAGEYGVLITWPRAGAAEDEESEAPESEDRLDGAYSNPNAPAWRKQVKPENNDPKDFTFILK
ncbi:MAG: hypothetical protein L0Y71_11375 [Gemmataceae bacterium]|nr:hypothetical protein [Gemmataceae bacterium]